MSKKIGNQNPTQSVILPYTVTLVDEAIAYYKQAGRTAQEWQEKLLSHMLAVNEDDLWTHTKIGYSLPRRNGKNEVVAMRELYALFSGEEVLHTAHRTTTSHAAWERLLRMLDKMDVEYDSLRAIGRERIELPDTGGRVEFRTRSSTGGLGEGFDLLVIDEAQEYTDDQESALKYVVTDSQNPQTIFCGTPPTPISSGTVFVNYRKKTLQGGNRNAMWAEWSVDKESDPQDEALWYQTNPSLGTIFTERSIYDEIGSDKIDFNIQRLGLWIKYNQKSAISAVEWERLEVDRLPKLKSPLYIGIKYGKDGENVALSIAVKTTRDRIFIESIDCQTLRNGNDWIIDFLSQADIARVAVDGASGQHTLAEQMKQARLKKPILPTVKEVIKANFLWEQAIYQETLCHKDQASLSQVVTNCEKRAIGSNGGFGYESQYDDMDIALMDSALLAHWLCSENKHTRRQQVRY